MDMDEGEAEGSSGKDDVSSMKGEKGAKTELAALRGEMD